MEAYRVNIVGLSYGIHHFRYKINDGFFSRYGSDLIAKGSFTSEVALDKRESFLEVNFGIRGMVTLVCDRSLEPFDHPIGMNKKVIFKFGEEAGELTDEMVVIRRDTAHLELGQYMYEFICLEVPMKKLHPRFRDEDEQGDGKIIYSSGPAPEDERTTDPRWDKLKNLNK